jgi:uncharacterized protein (TIGR02001 family)
MLTSVRSLMAATILAGCALSATPALADDSPISLSANVALVTDYRFRGIGLSGGDPAIQGGIDLSTTPGFYVGTWASSIDGGSAYGEMELDLYGGWSGKLTDGLDADVGVYFYVYPTNDIGPSDYYEIYGSLSPSVGPVSMKFGVNYAPGQDSLDFGGKRDNLYLYGNADVAIPMTPITLSGHLGYTDGSLTFTSNEKAWDYSIGASVSFLDHFSVGVSYIGVDGAKINGVTDDTVVGTLSASF